MLYVSLCEQKCGNTLSSRGFHWVTTGRLIWKFWKFYPERKGEIFATFHRNAVLLCLNSALPESIVLFSCQTTGGKIPTTWFLFLRLCKNFNDCEQSCFLWAFARYIYHRRYVYEWVSLGIFYMKAKMFAGLTTLRRIKGIGEHFKTKKGTFGDINWLEILGAKLRKRKPNDCAFY